MPRYLSASAHTLHTACLHRPSEVRAGHSVTPTQEVKFCKVHGGLHADKPQEWASSAGHLCSLTVLLLLDPSLTWGPHQSVHGPVVEERDCHRGDWEVIICPCAFDFQIACCFLSVLSLDPPKCCQCSRSKVPGGQSLSRVRPLSLQPRTYSLAL